MRNERKVAEWFRRSVGRIWRRRGARENELRVIRAVYERKGDGCVYLEKLIYWGYCNSFGSRYERAGWDR